MQAVCAKDLKGFLCRSTDNRYFFRTYDENGAITDYALLHSDLEIQILDSDAYIYERKGGYCIDHSPQTLGLDIESQ